LAEAGVF